MTKKRNALKVTDPGHIDGKRIKTGLNSYDITIEKSDEKGEFKTVNTITVSPYLYPVILMLYGASNLILFMIAFAFSEFNSAFTWGGFILALQMGHLALSFKNVNRNEIGGVLFYGKAVKEVDSGIVFVPLGLLQLVTLPVYPIQVQFPGDPEKIFKGSDEEYFKLSEEERKKFTLPIRALSGEPEKTGNPTSVLETQMTLEVNFYVRWTVEHFWVFLTRIGSVDEANRQLRDSGERVVVQAVSSRTPGVVVKELSEINTQLEEALEAITEDAGVRINEAAMLAPDLTHGVNQAMRDTVTEKAKAAQKVIAAEATARETVLTAEAEEVRLTREGSGVAAAKMAELKALAEGAKALGLTAAQVADLEKARAFASGNATVIVDGGKGASSLTGIGTRIAMGSEIAHRKE
jgi:regulator of protease activity HflC (stomatin/prohibitin superfamily)